MLERRATHHFAVLLALLAFTVRSLIPVGYMPDESGHGGLVICNGLQHSTHGPADKNGSHSAVCPFTVAAIFGFAHAPENSATGQDYSIAELSHAALPERVSAPYYGNASPRSPPRFS